MKLQKNILVFSTDKQYFFSTVILIVLITILYNIQNTIGYQAVSLILLLIIFLLPLFNFERGPIILSAIISALAWDYYFIPPHFTMAVANIYDVITLCMFFMVALTNGVLTARLKVQRNEMIEKERKYSALYKFVKDLSEAKNLDDIIRKSIMQIQNIFGFKSVVFLPEDKDKLQKNHHKASNFSPDEMEWLAAETAFKQKSEAGKGTDSLGGAEALYFPMILGRSIIYVLGVKIEDGYKLSLREKEFLRSFIEEVIPFIEKVLN